MKKSLVLVEKISLNFQNNLKKMFLKNLVLNIFINCKNTFKLFKKLYKYSYGYYDVSKIFMNFQSNIKKLGDNHWDIVNGKKKFTFFYKGKWR